MASFHSDTWRPPWAYRGRLYAVFIARTGGDGLVTSLEPPGDDTVVSATSRFLAARLGVLPESERSAEASFLYVLFRRAPEPGDAPDEIGRETAIAEFGYGGPPLSPEEWPLLEVPILLQQAIDS